MTARRTKAGPVRTCTGCGQRCAQSDLVRMQLDEARGLRVVERVGSGRSAYVHHRRECIEAVVKSRILRRSLRADVPRSERASVVAALLAAGLARTANLPDANGVLR